MNNETKSYWNNPLIHRCDEYNSLIRTTSLSQGEISTIEQPKVYTILFLTGVFMNIFVYT
jgi:hypothetical protein